MPNAGKYEGLCSQSHLMVPFGTAATKIPFPNDRLESHIGIDFRMGESPGKVKG